MFVFGFSALLIIAIFALKLWEQKRGRSLAPAMRQSLDIRALQVKELLRALGADFGKLPPEMVHFTRIGIHTLALGMARLAQVLEAQAHRLADLVSHQHRFERRAPRSEFLKKVIEHKKGREGSEVDTTE
jgi:hypothetical protein